MNLWNATVTSSLKPFPVKDTHQIIFTKKSGTWPLGISWLFRGLRNNYRMYITGCTRVMLRGVHLCCRRGQISLSTCRVKFHPNGDNCRQNNGQEINAVMFRPKSKLRATRWIIGTGRINSGGLSVKHATFEGFSRLSLSTCIFCFLNVSFLFQNYTTLCPQNRIIVDMSYFLKLLCFVANFVDIVLVDDRTSVHGNRPASTTQTP